MEGDDSWEEAALSSRHMHNRNDRGGRGNIRESFQIRNTFGTHLVKCPALERLQGTQPGAGSSTKAGEKATKQAGFSGGKNKKKGSRSNSGSGDMVLDIYRLTDQEDGVLGSLKFPGVFEAVVVFAGSRKLLGSITRHLGQDDTAEDNTPYGTRRGSLGSSTSQTDKSFAERKAENTVNGDAEDEDDSDEEESSSEDGGELSDHENRQRRRLATFEKNSFRQPKFWFRWQGVISEEALAGLEDLELMKGGEVHGSGYAVFSGNDCRRFQGTMTSEQLGWNNVKMTGWKAKPQPERDFEIQWSRES